MSAQELLIRSHVRMHGGAALSFDNADNFPDEPNQGQFALVDGILYIYAKMGVVSTWFPLTNKKNSHVHYQAIASSKWVITHNYASNELIYFAYDNNNRLMVANPAFIDENHFELEFGTAVKGKVVVFVHSDLWVPRMETTEGFAQVLTLAQYLNVAADTVILDNSGVTVNGTNLSTWIQQNQDRLTLLEGVVADAGTHGVVKKTLRPAAADVDIGDVNQRFGAVHATTLSTQGVAVSETSVKATAAATDTAEASRGAVAGNLIEAHARNTDTGLQPAEVRLIGTDGQTYSLRYDQATSALHCLDANGQLVDLTAKRFSGADLSVSGAATLGSLAARTATLGESGTDTLTVNANAQFKAPISFAEGGTLGNGNDDVTVNCGAENLFTVISKFFTLGADGQLTVKRLTVSDALDFAGTASQVNATTVNSGDQYLSLLVNTTGAPTLDGGLNVARGNAATASLRWDEALDKWLIGVEGDMAEVIRAGDGRLLTADQRADLTAGDDSTLHFHASDRDRASHTGTQPASTIHDFAAAVAAAQAVVTLATGKVDAVAGKGLSTHDLTDDRLAKLDASLTEVSWSTLKDAPDLTGMGPNPADLFTEWEVANLRSGKSATGETLSQTRVFGGDDVPAPELSGTGDIWFDTRGDATIVRKKDAGTGEFMEVVKIASEMLMRHSNVNYVTGALNTTHTFTVTVEGLPQPMILKENFLTIYMNRQLLRKNEYRVVDETTIEVLVSLSAGDELEAVTA